jgi:subtilase family serine protease
MEGWRTVYKGFSYGTPSYVALYPKYNTQLIQPCVVQYHVNLYSASGSYCDSDETTCSYPLSIRCILS